MYTHLGNGKMVNFKDVICVLDMDVVTQAKTTVNFLNTAEEEGFTEDVGNGLPKAVIVTETINGQSKVFFTNIAAQTIKKRVDTN